VFEYRRRRLVGGILLSVFVAYLVGHLQKHRLDYVALVLVFLSKDLFGHLAGHLLHSECQ
jgi:hypothetical protein